MTTPQLDDYRWLTSDAARRWLAHAAAHQGELATIARALRRELSAARTHLVLEQAELRERAREKFSRAPEMLFTRVGLEQASGEAVAAYKAGRFTVNQSVLDLCCGVGGDLASLAARGPAEGIDRDGIVVLLARHNCHVHGRETPTHVGDAAEANTASYRAWHCDPDRRPGGDRSRLAPRDENLTRSVRTTMTPRRTTRVELCEPGLETIERLLAQNNSAAIKLAPAAVAGESWSRQAELEWIGERGECRQQVAWFGELARHAGRSCATVLTPHGEPRTIVGASHAQLPAAASVGRFVFEPHAAVLAARLAAELAGEHRLAALAEHGGYLTGDHVIADRALAAFEVLEVLPLDIRRLRTWLRERQIGSLEVKKRGVADDPRRIRKQLQVAGEEGATLLVTRWGGRVLAILARRVGWDKRL